MNRIARPALFLRAPASAGSLRFVPSAALLTSRHVVLSSSSSSSTTSRHPMTFDMPRRRYAAGAGLSETEVTERVLKVVRNFHKVDPNAVKEKSHFINDLGLDSLDTVELVLALEDEFCLEIPEAEADKIQTVSDAVSYLITNPAAK